MDTPTLPQPGLRTPAPHRWFTAFWVILALWFALIVLVGLEPICFIGDCQPVGPLNFVIVAIPAAVAALVGLVVHRGLKTGNRAAQAVLVIAGACMFLVLASRVL